MSARSRLAIISRHVVLLNARVPVYAVILVEDERITEVIEVREEVRVSELQQMFREWNPVSFEHMCVSPGLVDLNVSVGGDWEDYSHLTQAAVTGGVTYCLATSGLHGNADSSASQLYCDVAPAYLLASTSPLPASAELEDYFAVKAYMYPPSAFVEGIQNHLGEAMHVASSAKVPLLVDASRPDPRLLYAASPCRHLALEERSNTSEWPEPGSFASAFAEDLDPASLSDSGSEQSPHHIKSENSPYIRNLLTPYRCTPTSSNLMTPHVAFAHDEINEFPYISTENHHQKHRGKSAPRQKTLLEDLAARIQQHMNSIQELSRLELMAYNKAGATTFVASQRRASLPGNIPLARPQRPLLRLSTQRAGDISLRERHYAYFLANHPDHWESNGIEIVLRAWQQQNRVCAVHFCNVSSAHSVAKLMTHRPKITCETCPHYLYFTAEHIKEGDTRLKTLPPIRGQENQDLLWDLLKTEQIDAISSHHQPLHPKYKLTGNWKQAANGLVSLGFTLQTLWTKLHSDSVFRLHYIVRLAKWCASGPARILGIQRERGSIEKGKYADLVVWDPELCQPGNSRSKFPVCCPYQGESLYGVVTHVMVRGSWAYEKGVLRPVGRMESKTGRN